MDYEECSLVGYTECTTDETSQELRDDQVARKEFPSVFDQLIHQVGGEAFIQRTCGTKPITIIELKEKPECEKVEKVAGAVHIFNMQDPHLKIWLKCNFPTNQEVCEKMWIPEAPFWKDTNCQ